MSANYEIAQRTLAMESIAKRQSRKERVVFTNGCFDILHVGHTRYLAEARALGDLLVVGLNSDISVRGIKGPNSNQPPVKGPGRPIVPEAERAEMLLAVRSVDFVCIFEEETPLELIQQVRPDILVKGGDWSEDQIVGASFVRSYGGDVRSLLFHAGHSTTDIIEKISKNG